LWTFTYTTNNLHYYIMLYIKLQSPTNTTYYNIILLKNFIEKTFVAKYNYNNK